MAYGTSNKRPRDDQQQQPQVQVQQSIGGPPPNESGQYSAAPNKKQRDQQQNGGPKHASPLQRYLRNDPTFRAQSSQLDQAMQDYRTQIFGAGYRPGAEHPFQTADPTSTIGQILQQFQSTRQGLQQQKRQDLPAMQSDFASRGLVNSGLYAKADNDYRTDYARNLTDLINSRQSSIQNVLNSLQQFQHNIQGQRQNARLEAIRRRAATMGLQ